VCFVTHLILYDMTLNLFLEKVRMVGGEFV
jgi:hypothetical protein